MTSLVFPDEILLDVFNYLYLSEIIYSFYDVLCEDQQLYDLISTRLRSVHLSKVDLRGMTKSQFLFVCRSIKSQENFQEQIRSLTLCNQYTFGQIRLFSSQIPFDRLTNLKRLTLIRPSLDEYHILFPTNSSQLTHLIIDEPECDDDDRVILIDEMSELIELTIRSNYAVQFRSEYCRLERLTVSQLNLIDLIGLSTFFPNLHYLDITLVGTESDFTQIHIPLLTVLKLRSSNVQHELCEQLMGNLLQLRELYYSNEIRSTKALLVDGYRCQSLIERLPLLENFEINLQLINTQSTDICEITASFQSSFYLSKNWNIVCESRPNSNDFHIYSVPMPSDTILSTATDSLVSSAVLPVDDPYTNVSHLKLNMTSNWPLVTRFFPTVHSLELSQLNHSKIIPNHAILSYLNKSVFLTNIRQLILPSPCHFDDSILRLLLQQSAPNIVHLDISCDYLLRLIKRNMLQAPLTIRILILRGDPLPIADREIFLNYFHLNLNCLSLYLQNNSSLPETIQLFLDQFQSLYSLDVLLNDPLTMLIHVQICQMIQQRAHASAELRPTNIRIWQK